MAAVIMLIALLFTFNNAAAFAKNSATSDNGSGAPVTNAKAAYAMDFDTGTVILSRNENEKLPIASMTKIMTALLVLEDVEAGKYTTEDEVVVSENAADMGGSQVFLDKNSKHTVGNLLKAVVVASANDAAVALAEHSRGSESAFVSLMNERAAEMGMTNTNFVNCTGLPALNGYSSAKDVSLMLKELVSHEKYFEYSKIWLEDYVHPDGRKTTITNTNKLVRFYNGCDGGKTGYTSEALFCLSATAKRGDMRIIATVIGEQNGKQRFNDVSDVFNYAFATYENKTLCAAGDDAGRKIEVVRGKNKTLKLTVDENLSAFSRKGEEKQSEIVFNIPDKIVAPVGKGEKIGTASLVTDGVVVKTVNVVAAEDAEKMSFGDAIKRLLQNW